MLNHPCPCGSGTSYADCCGRLHRGEATADTAEQLMRARYAAYALGETDYVFRTWHPRTRPDDVTSDGTAWTGLEVLDATDGGAEDDTGEVEFVAHHTHGSMHERSRFERRRGRWVYVDGDVLSG